jgi:hypothetical protein
MADIDTAPTNEDVKRFIFLAPMLDSALLEMREFSKKKQDGIVSATKIKILNRLLLQLKDIVKQEESAAYLDMLSEVELPQNSDAVLILGQYRAALDSFRTRNERTVNYNKTWITKEWLQERADEEAEEDEEEDDDSDAENGTEGEDEEEDDNDRS